MPRSIVPALAVAVTGLALSALLLAAGSPLASLSSTTPALTNVASEVNLPTVLFAMSGFPGRSAPPDAAVALVAVVQWLAYGVVAGAAWARVRRRPRRDAAPDDDGRGSG